MKANWSNILTTAVVALVVSVAVVAAVFRFGLGKKTVTGSAA